MALYPPVLVYHRISRRPRLAGTWVSPSALAGHLDTLLAAGFQPLPAEQWRAWWGRPANGSGFLVTFDDGTEDLYRYRAILLDRGCPAVVFVPAGLLGRRNHWEWPLPTRGTRHLNEGELIALSEAGWEIGVHGHTHVDLTRLGRERLAQELDDARRRLTELLARPVRWISYPYGRVNSRVATAAGEAGFDGGFVMSAAPSGIGATMAVVRRPVYCIDDDRAVLIKVSDPEGRSQRGRWELKKERAAHAVGRWTAAWR